MSNTMTAHEPINYLDSILNEEEKRCEYSHQWRNFTISRSGRFKSKNKKRDVVDGKLFVEASTSAASTSTTATATTAAAMSKETMNTNSRMTGAQERFTSYHSSASTTSKHQFGTNRRDKDNGKMETYKSFYETNL